MLASFLSKNCPERLYLVYFEMNILFTVVFAYHNDCLSWYLCKNDLEDKILKQDYYGKIKGLYHNVARLVS